MTTKQTNRNIALKVLNIVDELNSLFTYRSYSVICIALLSLKEHRSRDKRDHCEYFCQRFAACALHMHFVRTGWLLIPGYIENTHV